MLPAVPGRVREPAPASVCEGPAPASVQGVVCASEQACASMCIEANPQ